MATLPTIELTLKPGERARILGIGMALNSRGRRRTARRANRTIRRVDESTSRGERIAAARFLAVLNGKRPKRGKRC